MYGRKATLGIPVIIELDTCRTTGNASKVHIVSSLCWLRSKFGAELRIPKFKPLMNNINKANPFFKKHKISEGPIPTAKFSIHDFRLGTEKSSQQGSA